ncbi:hypothetical protein BU16DRAFT_72705 [Lophium mytilinum]|uniref:Rhodopsin domain-containing protein n=1 Tax=Lophium mytilinum TaxID=390894 RepID=A0A6A6QLE0_9PEZI|nr:hypothetical protein BU16DRAFT_72705 [Lophium mytilinum]
MFFPRSISDVAPPAPRNRAQNNPTLLFSWWCTGFSLVIILFRLSGRYVRNERLFREDKIIALSIIPLFARMAFVHVVLLYGTNNVNITDMSNEAIHRRELGSRMVLGARIFYAMFIWVAKLTVAEFLQRLTERFWKRSYDIGLKGIRIFLAATFVAVVISTLAECQPFDHYWQVSPDPGPQCRQGYANLITMGVADMITDTLLVVFPIPIIIQSAMPLKRKLSLVFLFSMSLALIAITGARVPSVIAHQGRQQFRTVFASGEILAATAVSNAIILGSFLRDRGIKKAKFKFGSTTDSMERPATRRPTLQQWGSDEDLIRDMGYRLNPDLQQKNVPRPAPVANIDLLQNGGNGQPFAGKDWQFPNSPVEARESEESDLKAPISTDPLPSPRDLRVIPPRRNVSFFDVGGLLEEGSVPSVRSSTITERTANTNISPTSPTSVHDFATPRRGSRALLSDLGGLLSHGSFPRRSSRPSQSEETHEMTTRNGKAAKPPPSPPTGVIGPMLARHETLVSLQDAGGLLTGGGQQLDSSSRSSKRSSLKPPSSGSHGVGHSLTRQGTIQSLQDVGGLLSPKKSTG